MLLTFPLFHALLALDMGLFKAGIVVGVVYLLAFALAVPMFNYLQYGKFKFWISDEYREYLKTKYKKF